jgi:uncharacterized protein (TIRG00374 family)
VPKQALGSLVVGILISAVCLWYAFRGVDLSAMAEGIGRVGVPWVLASVAGALLGLVVRAFRWRFLLAGGDGTGSWSLVSATFIGIMANNLLPARLGEVVRAWVLARREGAPVPTVLASIVVERLLDVTAALALMGLALAVSPDLGGSAAGRIKQVGIVVLLVVLAGLAVLVGAVIFRARLLARLELGTAGSDRPWARRGLEMGRNFLEGFCVLRGASQILVVAGLSLLVWVVAIASFHAMAQGFHLGLTPAQTTLVFVIVLFGVAIPSAPGFVGTFHGFAVAGLAMVAGAEATQAAAYATLLHGSHWLAINTVGIACLLSDRSLTWSGMMRVAREA